MSNSIQSTPQQPIKVPRQITVPVDQQQQRKEQQQDKKMLFILTIAILIFLLLLLLLFLSYMARPVGNSDQPEYPLANQNAISDTNADTDAASSGTDITSTTNTDQVTTQNEQGMDSGDDTDTTTTNTQEPLSEENRNENKTPTSENSSQNTQQASTETKSIEPDETTTGEMLADRLIEPQNTSNNTNFSLEQHDATLRIFGTIGKGSSFVFVFDRSGSMIGKPIRSAKSELIQALDSLNQKHRFNLIFYDDNQLVWKSSLVSATKKNKNNAVAFIEGISAGGETKPLQPLLGAISYKPEVIFFLTDGEFALNLDDVCQKTGKTKINVIQFGSDSTPSTLLKKLAERTKGDYRYIDIGQLDKL